MSIRPQLRRRGALLTAGLVAAVLCAGCGEAHFPTPLGRARPLAVSIAGAPGAAYAPLYTAVANGDFARGAIAASIRQSPDAGAALAALESHAAAVAVVSEPALLQARARGAAVVAIGALVSRPLDGVVSLAAHPLGGAQALQGRTVAVPPSALAQAELQTMLGSANVPRASVREVPMPADATAFLRGHRGAALLTTDWPSTAVALARAHMPAHVLEVEQAGVPPYSPLVLAVRVDEAHYDGPLLRAFLQSLTRGERAAAATPGAAAAALARANPGLGAEVARAQLARVQPLALPAGGSHPFGWQDPYSWRAFAIWMAQHHLLAAAANGPPAITDEFLPGQGETVVGAQ